MTDKLERDVDPVAGWCEQAGLATGTVRLVTMHGNPVLHRSCRGVSDFGSGLRELVADMFASMQAAEGVGLAANQIGVDARVFVYHCPDASGAYQTGVVINPVLVPAPGASLRPPAEEAEGCLSVPVERAVLSRAAVAQVNGQDLDGQPLQVRGDGVLARCLQHETDHLNGLLYVDRLSAGERKRTLDSLRARAARGGLPAWSEGAAG